MKVSIAMLLASCACGTSNPQEKQPLVNSDSGRDTSTGIDTAETDSDDSGGIVYDSGANDSADTSDTGPVDSGYVPAGYQLVWNDEFDGSLLDSSRWTMEVNGWGGRQQRAPVLHQPRG